MAVSARDKKALLTLLEQAQLVYLLTRLPKKQVLDDPNDLAAKPDSPELLWRRAKRVGPQVLREMRPLLEGEPEAAFMLDPNADAAKKPIREKKQAPRKHAARK